MQIVPTVATGQPPCRRSALPRIRRIIRFKTLRERLSDPDTNRADLMVLLMTYRWRLAPRTQQSSRMLDGATVDDLPASRLHAMFAPLEDAAIDALLRHDWPGNLRELERVASDLFCDADQRLDSTIRYEHVMQAIAEFFIPQTAQAAVHPSPGSASAIPESTRVILATVERALRQQSFNIGSILDGLKVYKLGSRPTLRRFLVKHKDLLSADVSAESKVQRFMKTHNRPV